MIRGLVEEATGIAREMPWFAPAFLVLTAFSIGAHREAMHEAEGRRPLYGARQAGIGVRVQSDCFATAQKFTVVVVVREHEVKLSVPGPRLASACGTGRTV
jgi:hypothetical protein